MAKVIPSGVLKLPNFAELDYNLKRQKTQDALKAEEFSSQFKEITGNYLAGDLEAVQSSYDAVEEARDRLATDPTNVTLIRALRTAHANHAKVAGTAQFLANNNRELKANFIANPDAYALSGTEGFRLLNLDANTPRSAEQIILAGASPLELNPAVAKMKNYNQVAEEAYKRFLRKENEFYDANGNLLKDKARDWFKTHMSSNFKNEKEVNNALIYEGYQQGLLGDGETASTLGYKIGNDDLTKINSKDWQEEFGVGLIKDFTTAALNQFESILPGSNISERDRRKDELQEQNIRSSINARFRQSGGKGQNKVIGFTTDVKMSNDEKAPLGTLWSTAGTKIAPSVFAGKPLEGYKPQYNITGFGFNGKNYFTRRLYQPTDSSMPSKSEIFPANQDDISAIKNTIGSNYFDLLISDFVPTVQNNEDPDLNLDTSKLTERADKIKALAEKKYRLDKKIEADGGYSSKIGGVTKTTYERNNKAIDSLNMNEEERKDFNSYIKQIPTTDEEKKVDDYKKVKSELEKEGLETLSSNQLAGFDDNTNTRDDVASVKSKYEEFVEKEISKIDGSSNFGYESKEEKIKDFINKLKKDIRKLKSIEELDEYIDSFKSSISEENEMFENPQNLEEGGKIPSNPLSKIVSRIKNAIYPS
mgnify:CR=1 FL=1